MSEPLTKLFMKVASVRSAAAAGRSFLESYPVDEIIQKAKHGRDALYPFSDLDEYGRALLGADIGLKQLTRFATLDQLVLLPPIFTPKRLEKLTELGREPYFSDVDLETTIGGFRSRMPVTMASMGSTEVAHGASAQLGRGAAAGELWKRGYTDPEVEPYFKKGLVAFEVKLGQGAKPGLGGETKVPRDVARSLKGTYYFPDDPERVDREMYERHSAPGTFTEDILRGQLRSLRNNFPRARIWIKAGPFRDLLPVFRVAWQERIDAVFADGKEGGTGMSPV